MASFHDQEADEERTFKSEWSIVHGIWMYFGYIPLGGTGDFNVWLYFYHGSHQDTGNKFN